VEFQARVFEVIASHAIPNDPACQQSTPLLRLRDDPEPDPRPACLVAETTHLHIHRLPALEGQKKATTESVLADYKTPKDRLFQEGETEEVENKDVLNNVVPSVYAAQSAITAAIVRAGSSSVEIPTLGGAVVSVDCEAPKDRQEGEKKEIENNEALQCPSLPPQSLNSAMPRIFAAQSVVTATIVRAGSSSVEIPSLGGAASLWPNPHQPSIRLGRTFSQTSSFSDRSSVASSGSLSVPEVRCRFLGRDGPVWVIPAGEKAIGRMREKVAEYRKEGAPWPRAGSILDPVRATVVCEGPAEMLEVASWFLSGADGGGQQGQFPVCRVKNKFAHDGDELVSACVLASSPSQISCFPL
jgi:hypothetical protein